MFKISMASLALALISISALAAPQVGEHERALQKASKWGDVSEQLKGRLPSNVVKEFTDFAKGIEFPSSRRIKNQLVFTQNDGAKVTIVYKKDGAISLNGKDWRLKPLATVEEEVTRLALFIAGEKKAESSLLGFVPSAQAAGAGAFGAAAAAFAGANAWKAESCEEEELSQDLVNDCPLMAVKMKPVLVKADAGPLKLGMYPIKLKCPVENGGTLEVTYKNKSGLASRTKVSYEADEVAKVSIERADPGTSFREIFPSGSKLPDEDKMVIRKNIIKSVSSIYSEVCQGSKRDREVFLAKLRANESDLRQSSYEEPDHKPSLEAL